MNKNKIQNNDDCFFQPKDILKREKEEKKKRKKLTSKIRVGLQNVKNAHENKNQKTKEEKLFLKIFSNIHLVKKYSKYWNGYSLKDENNKNICVFDSESNVVFISYNKIFKIFQNEFTWDHYKIQLFMEQMLKKYFKLYEFATSRGQRLDFFD